MREVKSKDPELVSLAMELQRVLTNIHPLFRSSKPLSSHHRESNPTTLPATTISTQRSQANQ